MPEGIAAAALAPSAPDVASARAISIAILAMGGEGGGVLADWIVDVAESNGFLAQSTSVPGVAQRTGATIYYLEMFPETAARAAGQDPVLAMMPSPGDVDVVVASELMEAARAVQRGLVTPDRTTLVASSHRAFAMTEKIAMGDGRADAEAMLDACRGAAARLVVADMAALAEAAGSVISASLLGGLAASSALPFRRTQWEDAIRRGGVGVEASLRAFAAGFDAATDAPAVVLVPPADVEAIVALGEARLADYQDAAYAAEYRARLAPIRALDATHGDGRFRLLEATARGLALWMAYEDTVRVAELKTRESRMARVAEEVRVEPGQILRIREFLHPRVEEIADTLPSRLGQLLLSRPVRPLMEAATRRGRTVETTGAVGFALLWLVAGMRRWRRDTLRFAREQQAIGAWLDRIGRVAPSDYALAVEIAECQRLVKGYGDTHARGMRNFDRLMRAADAIGVRPDAAPLLARLRDAALADEHGTALDAALAGAGITADA